MLRRHTCHEFFKLHASHVDLFADPRLPHYRPVLREMGVKRKEGGGKGRGAGLHTFVPFVAQPSTFLVVSGAPNVPYSAQLKLHLYCL